MDQWKGNWRLLRCGANTQSPKYVSYGLNHQFCGDATSVNPLINTARNTGLFSRQSEIVLSTDVAGDGRIYIYTPLKVYAPITAAPAWIPNSSLQPFLPVLRHRGGNNCGFMDGHVRWSPNMAIEDMAQTIFLRDNASVH